MTLAAVPVSQPVSVSRAEIASVQGRLRAYHARYAPFFGRRELRGHARAYLQGLRCPLGAGVPPRFNSLSCRMRRQARKGHAKPAQNCPNHSELETVVQSAGTSDTH